MRPQILQIYKFLLGINMMLHFLDHQKITSLSLDRSQFTDAKDNLYKFPAIFWNDVLLAQSLPQQLPQLPQQFQQLPQQFQQLPQQSQSQG